jgi:hypothetical protein
MVDSEGRGGPPTATAVHTAMEAQARALRAWASAEIERVKAQRDEELDRLDKALALLDAGRTDEPARGGEGAKRVRKASHRRASRSATTPAAVRRRRDAVLQCLLDQGKPLSRGDVCRLLRLTPHTVNTALNLLCREGKARRIGSGAGTRYEAIGGRLPNPQLSKEGTLGGRIVETVKERGYACLEELVQAVGAPREEVLRECGALLKQGEIQMDRREGRPVYLYRADS